MDGVQGLAQQLMHRLVTASQQVVMLQLPAFTARVAYKPVGIGVVRGSAWHILCAVHPWSVIVTPPPALATFGRRWVWHEKGKEPVDALATALAALSDEWWSKVPSAVGTLDVAGAITHAANVDLNHARGAICNYVYGDPSHAGADEIGRVDVGRDREDPRWPALVDVIARESAVLVRMRGRELEITDMQQLAREMPAIIEHLQGTDDACVQWLESLASLRATVTEWMAKHPPPIAKTEWTVWPPHELTLDAPPQITLSAKAHNAEQFYARLTSRLVHIGSASLELSADATAAIEREAQDARDPEMSDFERYR